MFLLNAMGIMHKFVHFQFMNELNFDEFDIFKCINMNELHLDKLKTNEHFLAQLQIRWKN